MVGALGLWEGEKRVWVGRQEAGVEELGAEEAEDGELVLRLEEEDLAHDPVGVGDPETAPFIGREGEGGRDGEEADLMKVWM